MGWNNNFRDCDRFWDDLMFGRCRHRDCDDRRCRRDRDCDCDECRRRRNHERDAITIMMIVEIGKFLGKSALKKSALLFRIIENKKES